MDGKQRLLNLTLRLLLILKWVNFSQNLILALGQQRQLDPYSSEPSKRHTMSYEPENIPAMDHIDQRPSPIKKQKEKVYQFSIKKI